MYYHVAVTNEKCRNSKKRPLYLVYELDITEKESLYEIVREYYRGARVRIKGQSINNREYPKMMIVQSEETAKKFVEKQEEKYKRMGIVYRDPDSLSDKIFKEKKDTEDDITAKVFDRVKVEQDAHPKARLANTDVVKDKRDTEDDITAKVFDHVEKETQPEARLANTDVVKNKKVFIVHGHNNELKEATARLVEKIGLEAVILHEQANEGLTIIQKLEKQADVGYAIILYTPCDEGRKKGSRNSKPRARQNVVFEHGLFMGKLGARRVCALRKSEVEMPSDAQGILYIEVKDGSNDWMYQVAKELKNAGYDVDLNKI